MSMILRKFTTNMVDREDGLLNRSLSKLRRLAAARACLASNENSYTFKMRFNSQTMSR